MIVIGITGPTGSGKGIVAEIFANEGFSVIDADKVYSSLINANSPLLKKISEEFGTDIIKKDGSLDRIILAERVFKDKNANDKLNSITHPAVMDEIIHLIEENKANGKSCVIDAPLLYEANADVLCDIVIFVTADTDLRLERVINRDGVSREKAGIRIEAQKNNDLNAGKADFILINNSDKKILREKVLKFIRSKL